MPTDHPIPLVEPIPEEHYPSSTIKCSICNAYLTPTQPAEEVVGVEVPVFAPAGITLSQEAIAPPRLIAPSEEEGEGERLCQDCQAAGTGVEDGGVRRSEWRGTGLGLGVGVVIAEDRILRLEEGRELETVGSPMEVDIPTLSPTSPGPADDQRTIPTHTASASQPIRQAPAPLFTSTSAQSISPFHLPSSSSTSTFTSTLPSTAGSLTSFASTSASTSTSFAPSSFGGTILPTTTTAHPQPQKQNEKFVEVPPNPLLDVGRLRMPSRGRGCLYPGSVFRGSQTSGRSSYSVEVRILDISLPLSTLSGYLSISHLTDSHPHLTTFFSGEIIGPSYGFLTGPRYYAQATEGDDMRHWSRFEGFRKVKNELKRPGLTLPDPTTVPIPNGVGMGEERSVVFMRWKERFLVPDHKVRDISGASFAGFYYIQVDMDPSEEAYESSRLANSTTTTITQTTRSTARRRDSSRAADSPIITSPPTSPNPGRRPSNTRRQSSGAAGSTMPRGPLRREGREEERGCLLNGFYFHQANSEPFQELSLRHVPQRGSGSLELR